MGSPFDIDEIRYGNPVGLSLSSVPKQPVTLVPSQSIAGVQIRQLQNNATPPQTSITPINIQRRLISGNVRSGTAVYGYSIQFFQENPNAANYIGTAVSVKTPQGTSTAKSNSNAGPISFTSTQTTAPTSVATSTSTLSGDTSTDFGDGNSRELVLI